MGGVITYEPEPGAHSSICGIIFTVQERNKEDMGQLRTATRVKMILRKTKGIHMQPVVEYAGYFFLQDSSW